ncbi:MAG: hypothetical protein KJ645_08295, partial [Planctomycetes bacterium]|nr:hypothetical protein [Planctomycetota bacterium]
MENVKHDINARWEEETAYILSKILTNGETKDDPIRSILDLNRTLSLIRDKDKIIKNDIRLQLTLSEIDVDRNPLDCK